MAIHARTNYANVAIDIGALDPLWTGHGKHMGAGASIGVVMDPLGGGFKVQKHTIVDGACWPVDCSSGERAEVLNTEYITTPTNGGRFQLGFGLYLPSDFSASSGTWNSLCQMHYGGSIQQSPWGINLTDQGTIQYRTLGGPLNQAGTMGTIAHYGAPATISRGAWHTFCMDVKLDLTDGMFDLWIDGTQVLNLRDSTLSPGAGNDTYWKQGFYRSTSESATNHYYFKDTVCWKNSSPNEMLQYYGVIAGTSPTISGFTPISGSVGTSVTITGTNFTGATSVKFNGVSA
jgi:hypothetical protein